MTQPEPEPREPHRRHDVGRPAEPESQHWEGAGLPADARPPSEDLLDDPVIQDVIRRLELLEGAKNLRLRTEADLNRARQAGQRGDAGLELGYLRRAVWNIRAAHRLQDEAGAGLGLAEETTTAAAAVPLLDVAYHFRGLCGAPSCCRLRVYEPREGPLVVIATELPENPGTSITNFVEELAAEVWALLERPARGMVWIEHYPERGPVHRRIPEGFDRVTFARTERGFSGPQWRRLPRAEVEQLIGGPLEEALGEEGKAE